MFKGFALQTAECAFLVALCGACGSSGGGDGAGGSGTDSGAGGSAPGGAPSGGAGTAGAPSAGMSPGGAPSGGTSGASTAGNAPGGAGSAGTGGGSGGNVPLPPELVWTKQGPNRIIEDIWGSGADDVYAVGRTGTLLYSKGDGTWTFQDADTAANLTGIWGSGKSDIYISVDSNVMLHSTGDGMWEHQVYDAGFTFRNVGGLDADNVFVVGPGVVRRSGTGWQRPPEQVTSGAPTFAIAVVSPTDLYAATSNSNNSTIFHSTGDGRWRAQTVPAATVAEDILAVDATHLYAAADNYVLFSTGNGTWTVQLTTPGVQKVFALWAAGPDAIYACTQEGFFYRSNGKGQWSEGQDVNPAGTTNCYSIWGTGPDNIYVGDSSGVYHGTAD